MIHPCPGLTLPGGGEKKKQKITVIGEALLLVR